MLQIKLEPQEIQLAIVAISQMQFQGKDAHLVSSEPTRGVWIGKG